MNKNWLHKNRIAYRCYPYSDNPTYEKEWGWFYEDGTDERFTLFNRDFKINSYKSLYWHLSVIWWINSSVVNKYNPITYEEFLAASLFICDKSNGFIAIDISSYYVEKCCISIAKANKKPKNKSVKFVFKEGTGLTFSDKMKIVGKYSKRQKTYTKDELKKIMKKINDSGATITNKLLSLKMNCSTKTIQRLMDKELKETKEKMNEEL